MCVQQAPHLNDFLVLQVMLWGDNHASLKPEKVNMLVFLAKNL